MYGAKTFIELLSLVAALAAGGCAGDPTPTEAAPVERPAELGERVLFVGNSLTEANDLPLMVEALSQAAGHPLGVDAITYGGASLEDHWTQGTQNRIASG